MLILAPTIFHNASFNDCKRKFVITFNICLLHFLKKKNYSFGMWKDSNAPYCQTKVMDRCNGIQDCLYFTGGVESFYKVKESELKKFQNMEGQNYKVKILLLLVL